MTPGQGDRLSEKRLGDLEQHAIKADKASLEVDRRVTRLEINFENFRERAQEFVTRQEFTPIRMIVYGLAATALTGLLSAILARLFTK